MPFFQVKYQASLKFSTRFLVVFHLDWHGALKRSPCVNSRADFPGFIVLIFFTTLSLRSGKSLTCLNCGSHGLGSVALMGIFGTDYKIQTAWIVYGCFYCSAVCITNKCKSQSIRWACGERMLECDQRWQKPCGSVTEGKLFEGLHF